MKKIFAIIFAFILMASTLTVNAFAADPAAGTVMRVIGVEQTSKTTFTKTILGDFESFQDGWNYAMKLAGDEDEMEDNKFDRVLVELYADWKANDDGEFTEEIWNGKGFDNDTIYIPDDARVTLNLNGHTIDRGLTEDEDDGEVMFINDDADVIINNGTITGGYSNSEGGALYIEGANVTLNNVNIIGNRVYNDDGAGIAMCYGATLTVNGGSFENNVTDGNTEATYYGGAIYSSDSTATFKNVVFKNNGCKHDGSAIYSDDSDIIIENCTFDGNKGRTSVIYAEDSYVKMTDSAVLNSDSFCVFEIDYTELVLNSSVFENNESSYVIGTSYSNTIFATDSKFMDKNSGALYASPSGLCEGSFFRNCTVNTTEKTEDHNGTELSSFRGDFANMVFYDCSFGESAFKYAKNVTIENSKDSATDAVLSVTLIKKDGTEKTAYYKALDFGWNSVVDAVETNNYERVIVDLYADWNTNKYGVVTVPANAKMTVNMNGHTIDRGLGKNNQDNGEVICVNNGADLIINGGKEGDAFVKPGENTANVPMGKITGGNSDDGAGGIHIYDGARVTLNNVNIVGNTTDDDDGAGIAAYDGATLIMNGGSISNNILWCSFWSYDFPYGSLYLDDSTAYLNGVEFVGNQFAGNYSADGVAIYADNSRLVAENCTFKENGNKDAVSQGLIPNSIVCLDEGSMELINCVFEDNGVPESNKGGDIVELWGGTIKISNSVFRNNSCDSVIDCRSGILEVSDTVFEDNYGRVFWHKADEGSFFKNCTFSGNTINKSYKTFDFDEENNLNFENCDFGDSTFNDRSRATFDGKAVGSIFGEGSLSMIVSLLALVASVACMGVTISLKKKLAPVAANNTAEANDEE